MSDVPAGESAFELSRAYGEGWKAAKKLLASAGSLANPAEAAASRNPYHTDARRARWTQGFIAAGGTAAPALTKRGGSVWRRHGGTR